MKLPIAARRLFPEVRESVLERESSTAYVVTRLLADGDSADLASLFSQLGEADVLGIFEARAHRQLDRRSRAFWALLLAVDEPDGNRVAEELWAL